MLFRTGDRGDHWQVISPDLTRNDKSKQQWSGGPITGDITGVEYYDTIFSIAESPVTAGEIWVGTDDGLVQVTRDAGQSWKKVTPRSSPNGRRSSSSSPPCTRRAPPMWWATTTGSMTCTRTCSAPATTGTARRISGAALPQDQHLYVVREDPTDANLLYVGERARAVLLARCGQEGFQDLRNNLPAVGVSDIEVKHDDLILGTRRGIWILDDLSALRAFTPRHQERSGAPVRAAFGSSLPPGLALGPESRGAHGQCAAGPGHYVLAEG